MSKGIKGKGNERKGKRKRIILKEAVKGKPGRENEVVTYRPGVLGPKIEGKGRIVKVSQEEE